MVQVNYHRSRQLAQLPELFVRHLRMFWKNKKAESLETPLVAARTIPAEFYGGANPQVAFKTVTKEVPLVSAAPSAQEKKMLEKATAAGSGEPLHPATLLSNPRFLIIAGGIFFVIALVIISWYYWRQAHPNVAPLPAVIPLEVKTDTTTAAYPTQTTNTVAVIVTTTDIIEKPATLTDTSMTFPSTILGISKDSDGDKLTDVEEELFNTDSGTLDTDADGYSDDLEIDNLYNPAGKAPVRLVDAGTVKEFNNPVFGYQLLYPTVWAGGINGNVDQNYRDVLFSTLTGENIEVKVFDKDASNQSFVEWFGTYAVGERFEDLVQFTSYYKAQGFKRKDGLVYYFEQGQRVYVIAYHTTNSSIVNYPTVMKLMARSLRFASSDTDVPVQTETDATLVEPTTTKSVVNSTTVTGI